MLPHLDRYDEHEFQSAGREPRYRMRFFAALRMTAPNSHPFNARCFTLSTQPKFKTIIAGIVQPRARSKDAPGCSTQPGGHDGTIRKGSREERQERDASGKARHVEIRQGRQRWNSHQPQASHRHRTCPKRARKAQRFRERRLVKEKTSALSPKFPTFQLWRTASSGLTRIRSSPCLRSCARIRAEYNRGVWRLPRSDLGRKPLRGKLRNTRARILVEIYFGRFGGFDCRRVEHQQSRHDFSAEWPPRGIVGRQNSRRTSAQHSDAGRAPAQLPRRLAAHAGRAARLARAEARRSSQGEGQGIDGGAGIEWRGHGGVAEIWLRAWRNDSADAQICMAQFAPRRRPRTRVFRGARRPSSRPNRHAGAAAGPPAAGRNHRRNVALGQAFEGTLTRFRRGAGCAERREH